MTSSPESPAEPKRHGARPTRDAAERAQTERLETYYVKATSELLQGIERSVCGCDYGGCSWTTRAEAERIAALLELRAGKRLLDVGAGSGWPGLYMSQASGCDLTLTDLPLAGLRIAAERAAKDGLSSACWAVVADGASLPFADRSFDAISHSDVLCCLKDKRGVLASCRRAVREDGKMAFSVISISPGLSRSAYRRAVECGPEFVEADAAYTALQKETGWRLLSVQDVTAAFARSCKRMLEMEDKNVAELSALLGAEQFRERSDGMRRRHEGASTGLIRREIFLAAPA